MPAVDPNAVAKAFFERAFEERLALELHRAVRPLVDTGVHAKRRTRAQAIRYDVDNSANTEGAAIRACRAPGERFDVRDFHDLVLRTGAVPLDVLESGLGRWIESRKG